MLQYKIPQNIGIQDRIVGPFTLKQLGIVALGGGISYVIFLISSKVYELNIIEYILISLPLILSLAFALVKVNNVTFFKFLLLAMEFSIKPKKRYWNHRSILSIVSPNLTETKEKKEDKKIANGKSEKDKKNVNLDDLTKVLDSGGFEHIQKVEHKDIDSVKDDNLITQAFFGHKKKQSKTQNMYWRTVDSQKKRLEIMAKYPTPKKESQKESKKEAEALKTESSEIVKKEIENKAENATKSKSQKLRDTDKSIKEKGEAKQESKAKENSKKIINQGQDKTVSQKKVVKQTSEQQETVNKRGENTGKKQTNQQNVLSNTSTNTSEGEINFEDLQKAKTIELKLD